jgi:hypothetical protein
VYSFTDFVLGLQVSRLSDIRLLLSNIGDSFKVFKGWASFWEKDSMYHTEMLVKGSKPDDRVALFAKDGITVGIVA